MSCVARRVLSFASLIVAAAVGCQSIPHMHQRNECRDCRACGCQQPNCDQCCGDPCCEESSKGPKRYSDEWWAIKANRPVGARQKERKGKLWPPFARPVEEEQEFSHKYHAAHYWPHPYVCQDRKYVRDVLQMQVDNGWIAETTLYGFHFDPETHELTKAGRLQLRWILENAPERHRMAWVQTAVSQEVSQDRLEAVKQEVLAMVGEEHAPPVMLRVATPLGRPALEVDVIRRAEIESIPEPRITYEPLPTGAGGGGS